jgi:hypothetical protein
MKMKITALVAAVAMMMSQTALGWGDQEQAAVAGAAAGAAGVILWQRLSSDNRQDKSQQSKTVIQQHPVYKAHPTFNGDPNQFIPQDKMNMPTAFQEPCQGPGHHARIYDRYGKVIAIRVC